MMLFWDLIESAASERFQAWRQSNSQTGEFLTYTTKQRENHRQQLLPVQQGDLALASERLERLSPQSFDRHGRPFIVIHFAIFKMFSF